jgi:hypothetical protein
MVKWSEKEAAIKSLLRGGQVDPNDLIEAARDPEHPCHGDFTWDVDKAVAERHRDQARSIIRRCKFEVIIEDVTVPVVSYVSSPKEDDVFVSVVKVRSKSQVADIMAYEVGVLHGVASRVYGIAVAKRGIVGSDVVSRLGKIREQIAALSDDLLEE